MRILKSQHNKTWHRGWIDGGNGSFKAFDCRRRPVRKVLVWFGTKVNYEKRELINHGHFTCTGIPQSLGQYQQNMVINIFAIASQ